MTFLESEPEERKKEHDERFERYRVIQHCVSPFVEEVVVRVRFKQWRHLPRRTLITTVSK
jgi:hypothetical protein